MAAVQYLRAYDLLVAAGEYRFAGNALLNAGVELSELGNQGKAVGCFQSAAEVFGQIGDEDGRAKALRNIEQYGR